ncbi:hypothetical protein vBBcePLY3_00005 [Bacillus phage vB_BceP_LY3]|uniref:Uncharacterized protein n=1 Tax=Bacillus phage vB_BceP_LY3 TaxID=2950458 RepID=A0AAE9LVB9_9CAUD|nr:hypothetical protein vBBcePLY3_00005 [Bacillus phage vB_BceP_LY3]
MIMDNLQNINKMLKFAKKSSDCMLYIVEVTKEAGFTAEELFSAVQSLNKIMEEKKND